MLELLMMSYTPVVVVPDQFVGEVPTSQFISGDTLAVRVGLSAGVAQNDTAPWLQFVIDNKTLYVASKTYRRNMSWDQLNSLGIVYGARTLLIQGKTYKVRLIKGTDKDPTTLDTGFDVSNTYGSEWNRMFYPLIPNPTTAPTKPSGEGIVFGSWASYTEFSLEINTRSWCQEAMSGYRSWRGLSSVTNSGGYLPNEATGTYWRPCLELVR